MKSNLFQIRFLESADSFTYLMQAAKNASDRFKRRLLAMPGYYPKSVYDIPLDAHKIFTRSFDEIFQLTILAFRLYQLANPKTTEEDAFDFFYGVVFMYDPYLKRNKKLWNTSQKAVVARILVQESGPYYSH